MIKVGIDNLALYTSHYALDLTTLANARDVDPDKFRAGLGQWMMSVPPPGEDIVTMAANAAKIVLADVDKRQIDLLLFATESGIDQSKAAGIYVHDLLGLQPHCRIVELKQACYGATAGLQLAMSYLRDNPHKKVLLIASDIARYGLQTSGESSQGCGAVALLLSVNPRLVALEAEYGVVTENVMDFWRPTYLDEARVEGKYSSKLYLSMLEKSWMHYAMLSGRSLHDHAQFCYHIPVPRLAEKGHHHLLKLNHENPLSEENSAKQIKSSLEYGRKVGNSYTASLYIGLASLLDLTEESLDNQRIGFYSYGSGCVAEFFSGVVQPGYQEHLNTLYHTQLLASRTLLTQEEYEHFYNFNYVKDGSDQIIPHYQTGWFRLSRLEKHKRIYEKVAPELVRQSFSTEPFNMIAKGQS